MSRFDRYLFFQFLVVFGFFSLVLVLVYWVNTAVILFDRLISGGHSAQVFLEFSLLAIPKVIAMILPMSAFASMVFVANRLSSESESTVVQATGFSPWRLMRPVMAFGLIVALFMSVLTHFIVPVSNAHLKQREQEIAGSISARLLREGVFLHPSPGITFYIREITSTGELKDDLLADHRSETTNIVYSAETAYLLREGERSMLIMVNGLAQRYQQDTNALSTTLFSDLSYDVSNLVGTKKVLKRGLSSISSYEMIVEQSLILQETKTPLERLHKEVHNRIQEALLCIVAAFIGFASLLLASFSRFGSGPQILLAILLLILIKLTESALGDLLRSNPSYWPLIYAPTLVGGMMSYGLLAFAAKPFKRSVDLTDQVPS